MFLSIDYSDFKDFKYNYLLLDTDFKCNVAVDAERLHRIGIIELISAIVVEYSRRNLNVAKNLARYYIHAFGVRYTDSVKKDLDKHYPQLEFGKKYHKCFCNQVKQQEFAVLASRKQKSYASRNKNTV